MYIYIFIMYVYIYIKCIYDLRTFFISTIKSIYNLYLLQFYYSKIIQSKFTKNNES